MARRGFFVVLEGGDGAGKSTQIPLLAEWLRGRPSAPEVVVTREPGGTELGVEIRALLQHGSAVDARAEALLYAADRAHHVATVVRPALERGAIVVSDRYVDSSIAYQGRVRGLGEDEVARISAFATGGLAPDLTVVLDLPAAERRLGNEPDRLERETGPRADDLRRCFLDRAAAAPDRYAVVDGAGTVEDVAAAVRAAVEEALARGASA